MHANPAPHAMHAPPPLPQAELAVPTLQVLAMQHPKGQVMAPQPLPPSVPASDAGRTQEPPLQISPAAQPTHWVPRLPHALTEPPA